MHEVLWNYWCVHMIDLWTLFRENRLSSHFFCKKSSEAVTLLKSLFLRHEPVVQMISSLVWGTGGEQMLWWKVRHHSLWTACTFVHWTPIFSSGQKGCRFDVWSISTHFPLFPADHFFPIGRRKRWTERDSVKTQEKRIAIGSICRKRRGEERAVCLIFYS